MSFKPNNPGCPCDCGSASNVITVPYCGGVTGYPGVSVAVSQSGSPISGSPFTTNAAGQIGITPPSQTAALTLVSTAPSARFAVTTTTVPLSGGVLPATFTQALSPAAGFACMPGCLLPVKTVLNYSGTKYSQSGTLRFGQANVAGQPTSSGGWTIFTGSVNYKENVNTAAVGSCSAQFGVGIFFLLTGVTGLTYNYQTAGGAADCPSAGNTLGGGHLAAASSHTCPESGAFSAVFTAAFDAAHPIYPGGTTITVTE